MILKITPVIKTFNKVSVESPSGANSDVSKSKKNAKEKFLTQKLTNKHKGWDFWSNIYTNQRKKEHLNDYSQSSAFTENLLNYFARMSWYTVSSFFQTYHDIECIFRKIQFLQPFSTFIGNHVICSTLSLEFFDTFFTNVYFLNSSKIYCKIILAYVATICVHTHACMQTYTQIWLLLRL